MVFILLYHVGQYLGAWVCFIWAFFILTLSDREVNTNTVSFCGYECLGYAKTTVDGKTKFKDQRKVKAADISGIFGVEITTAAQLDEKKFQNCRVFWDRSGNITQILFEEPFHSIAVPKSTQKSKGD